MSKPKRPVVPIVEHELKRWSYSSWATMDECPSKFYWRYIVKKEEPPQPALERGTSVHTLAEHWLEGKIKGLPPVLHQLSAEFQGLKKLKPKVEAWWGVTSKWKPQAYGGWLVGKADAHLYDAKTRTLTIIDHKTGKIYLDKHEKQASLYAALGAAHYPLVKSVEAEFWYLDLGQTRTFGWTAAQVATLQQQWSVRGNWVMTNKNFEPKPGFYCRWCSYSREVKGPCKVA